MHTGQEMRIQDATSKPKKNLENDLMLKKYTEKRKRKKENLQCILDRNENPSCYHYEKIKLIPRTFKIPVRHFTK